jgi:predicted metal-binding membrane protein
VWIAALDMALEAGTMGLSIGEFVVMWTLMMAAMMLPAVSPLVSMYARSVRGSSSALTAFGAGYLLVWASTGVVAYVLTWLFRELAEESTDAAHAVAVGTFLVFGAYHACATAVARSRTCCTTPPTAAAAGTCAQALTTGWSAWAAAGR